ncbi:MAG: formylglycine-generating enzyme family protein, partial [Rhodoplanes sp.]
MIFGWVAFASAMLAASVAFADPAQDRQYKPGDTFKDCAECPEMVVVPAGSFMMGSPQSEKGRTYYEGPQHRVTFSQPFAVGKYAVTFDEWDACVADGGCNGYKPSDADWGRGKRPVVNVSWNDAQAYISWLKRKTGRDYHLPSEAQREYVTRASTTTPFWWGSTISADQANYTEDGEAKSRYRYQTAPADSFQPNPWGLFQVHGNVSEWTEDCWKEDYSGAPTD